ncbi:MAG: enoyl-CoA hydratase-related protein [Brachymonas sp.]
MTEHTVLSEERNAGNAKIALITFNRPESLNSFTPEMHNALREELAKATQSGARCAVLTGAGRGFCAGADLSSFDFTAGVDIKQRANPGPSIERNFNPTARAIMNLPMPTVCAVNGVAAGAGVSFALSCDVVIAAPAASFIQAFSKIGLIPDAGGSWHLPQRIGLARALALSLTGDKLSAAQAKEFGLIWDVQDDPLAAALAFAQKLANMPTKALVETRRLLRQAHTRSFDQQLDAERDAQTAMGMTDDYIEGVSAFLQKRVPEFKGQ